MKPSRLFCVALIVGGVAAAIPSFGAEPADPNVGRIVAGEQQFLSQMKTQKPFVETYIQQLNPVEAVPIKDDYLLMRMDLSKADDETTLTESAAFKKPWLHYLFTGPGLRFHPDGFIRMAFVDMTGFNASTYKFEYLRKDFLGDVRCLVYQVSPSNPKEGSRFVGDIWVDDAGYRIVRFNGTFTHGTRSNEYLHFDSWRVNVAPDLWVPAFVYVEEGNGSTKVDEKYALKARVMLWGYESGQGAHLDEMSEIHVDSNQAVDSSSGPKDLLPIESQRAWEAEAEQNVLDKLERSGLLAPPGDVDQVLDTVVNNLLVTNHIDLNVKCRVLLTTPFETFSMYRTIVISRGLLDVLPDEASLAMVLSEELAHIVLGHKTPTAFAFGDMTMFQDQQILDKLNVARTPEEMDEAGRGAIEILSHSPYADKLANAGLFLKAVGGRMQVLSSLVHANLGNEFASRANLERLVALEAKAPPLDNAKIDQIAALPLGSRIKLNPWNDEIAMVKTEQLPLVSAREKMPFEITPVMLPLTKIDGADGGVAVPAQTGTSQ